MAKVNYSYSSAAFGNEIINIEFDTISKTVTNGIRTGTFVVSGYGNGIEFVRWDDPNGVDFYALKTSSVVPYATTTHGTYSGLPNDLFIDSVAIVDSMNGINGSVSAMGSGSGTKRWNLKGFDNLLIPVANWPSVPSGNYELILSRTEDSYKVSKFITVKLISNLAAAVSKNDLTANGSGDGKIRVNITAGSGDYDVYFVTEAVHVPALGTPTFVDRAGLNQGSYEIIVTDNVTAQNVNFTVTLVEPAPASSFNKGLVFEVPMMNSIHFVVANEDAEQGLDNRLLCQQYYEGFDQTNYFQKYNIGDKPKVQFNSDHITHSAELRSYGNDGVISVFDITTVEENLGKTEEFGVTLKEHVPGQTRVYFQTGEIPVPLAQGDTFTIQDNSEGMNGTFAVVAIDLDEDTNFQYIIINLIYIGVGLSSLANGEFLSNSTPFNVFEFTADFTGLPSGDYYIAINAIDPITNQALSEPIRIKEKHTDTILIVYSNYDNADDITWTTGYTGFIRVDGHFGHKRTPGGERTVSRDANFSLTKVSAKKTRGLIVDLYSLPPYLHEKLSCVFDLDVFSINNTPCQSQDGYNDPDFVDRFLLANSSIIVEQLNWFNKYNSNDDLMSTVSEETGCLCDEIDLVAVSTNPGTMVLDLNKKRQRIFNAQPTMNDSRVVSLINAQYGLSFKLKFSVSDLFTGGLQYLEFPDNFMMADNNWENATHRWTPVDNGNFVLEAVFNGTNWFVTIFGSFN